MVQHSIHEFPYNVFSQSTESGIFKNLSLFLYDGTVQMSNMVFQTCHFELFLQP